MSDRFEAITAGLRTRELGSLGQLRVDKTGRFFLAMAEFHGRMTGNSLTEDDRNWLERNGHISTTALAAHAKTYVQAKRQTGIGPLDYLILVPTLRCNLACSYCQVSRAAPEATGFDWNESTLSAVLELVRGLSGPAAKIEFQGGEPTLRPDLIKAVMEAAPAGVDMTYVVCTNLQEVDDVTLAIFDRPDVQISTSLDGPVPTHLRQRQGDLKTTEKFLSNLDRLLDRYGTRKISALPTVDPRSPPKATELIEAYASRGLTSIYLRPINYQGFARKRHSHSQTLDRSWQEYCEKFIYAMIERNWSLRSDPVLEETYFSHLLKRIFRPGQDRHVDLRNPNPVGRDYVVIDYDGRAYPSDEARMLTRSGIIDLSIGDVSNGWDTPEREALEQVASNLGDPDCDQCTYQAFCGRDIIDDISRYGTIDRVRTETEFCRRHIHLFDLAFRLIYSSDEKIQYSLRRWLGLAGDSIRLGASR